MDQKKLKLLQQFKSDSTDVCHVDCPYRVQHEGAPDQCELSTEVGPWGGVVLARISNETKTKHCRALQDAVKFFEAVNP